MTNGENIFSWEQVEEMRGIGYNIDSRVLWSYRQDGRYVVEIRRDDERSASLHIYEPNSEQPNAVRTPLELSCNAVADIIRVRKEVLLMTDGHPADL